MKRVDIVACRGCGSSTLLSRIGEVVSTFTSEWTHRNDINYRCVTYKRANMSNLGDADAIILLFDTSNICTLKKLVMIVHQLKEDGKKILAFGNKDDIALGVLPLDVIETVLSSNDIPLILGSALTGKNINSCISYVERML